MLKIQDDLVKKIKNIEKKVNLKIKNRLKEFQNLNKKSGKEWFSELCFCILTANSRAHTAINIQKELKAEGFCDFCANDVKKCVIKHKHRFHNNKTRFIIEARKNKNIKKIIKKIIKQDGEKAAREWLVKNIKGIGYKEASHFLRNVGYKNLAILDRHIINLMVENKIINKPKNLNKKNYLKIEKKFQELSEILNMSAAELDLRMWRLKTGEVLK